MTHSLDYSVEETLENLSNSDKIRLLSGKLIYIYIATFYYQLKLIFDYG